MSQPIGHYEWSGVPLPPASEIDVNRHVLRADLLAHDHDFVEVALVTGGSAEHQTLYGTRRIGAGDAIVIRPGAWHAYRAPAALAVVNCCVRTHLLALELAWLAGEPRLRHLLWPGVGDGVVIVALPPTARAACDTALAALEAPPPGGQAPRPHQLAHLLLLLRAIACELDPATLDGAQRLASAPAAVADALALLVADPARAWTVDALAHAVAVSPAHLSRLFRRAVGRPPMAHLHVLRAEAAAARLLRGDEPIAAVGAAVGWGDPNHFARRFRAHFGVSPRAYRAARRRSAPATPPARDARPR